MQSERGIFCAGFASGFYLIGFINNAPIWQTHLTHVHSPYGCKTFLIHLHLWFVANYPKCYGRHEWSCLWIKSFLQRLMSCKACCIYEAIFRATFWRIYLDTLDSVLTRSRYFFVDVWGREREPQWRQCHAFQCNVALRNICYYVSRLWVE